MTAPNIPLPTSTDIDAMEQLYAEPAPNAAPAPPAPLDMGQKLEGDAVPSAFRGKSVTDLAVEADALRRALEISERGRMEAMRMAGTPIQPQQPVPQPKEWTRDELAEMMGSDDPSVRLQAVDILNTQALNRAAQQVEARFQTLAQSSLSAAEMEARRMYPKEFELFGDQISGLARQVPDPTALTNISGWRQLVQFVRGMDGNIQQYAQAISSAPSPGIDPASLARAVQSASAGFTAQPTHPVPGAVVSVDPITAEIASVFGWNPVEYAKALAALDK